MSEVQQLGERDRLPWLEPYREKQAERPAPTSRPRESTPASARRGYVRVPLWLFILFGAGLLGAGGYFIGRQSLSSRPGSTVTEQLPQATLPYHSLDELANEAEPPPPPPLSEVEKTAEAPPPVITPAPIRKAAAPARRKASATRHATRTHRPVRRATKPAVQRSVAKRRPRFVLRMSPPPVAGRPGQVIELGRFTSPRTADAVWRRAVWRYPYLGRLSKVVAPTRSNRPQPVFALRLGTGSRSHAVTLCRNLHSIGYPCAVV